MTYRPTIRSTERPTDRPTLRRTVQQTVRLTDRPTDEPTDGTNPEQCDPGGFATTAACVYQEDRDGNGVPAGGDLYCQSHECGDGIVGPTEDCDEGDASGGTPGGASGWDNPNDSCAVDCRFAVCGDGIVQAGEGEECDDANDDDSDACLSTCIVASCGDGFVLAGVEDCDDMNDVDTDDCLSTCDAASCGDGFVEAGEEECDDMNDVDNVDNDMNDVNNVNNVENVDNDDNFELDDFLQSEGKLTVLGIGSTNLCIRRLFP